MEIDQWPDRVTALVAARIWLDPGAGDPEARVRAQLIVVHDLRAGGERVRTVATGGALGAAVAGAIDEVVRALASHR